MKINEIVSEGQLRKAAKKAVPDMEKYQELDNNNSPYLAYRFGVALAVSPNTHMDQRGPIGGSFTTIGYTDADREIIDGAKKIIGVGSEQETSDHSTEMDVINKTSPFKPRGPIQLKKKK